jgi:putative endonuclease
LASRRHGTLYTGVTSDVLKRVGQHRAGEAEGFKRRYGVKRLVWFERHDSIVEAIQRETSIKRWRREWKINLIERDNPHWDRPVSGSVDRAGAAVAPSASRKVDVTVLPPLLIVIPGLVPGTYERGRGCSGAATPLRPTATTEFMGSRHKAGNDDLGGGVWESGRGLHRPAL